MIMTKRFSERLSLLMEKAGFSNYGLSNTVNCSPSSVSSWLRGNPPSAGYVTRLASTFNVPEDYLKGEVDEYGLTDDDWSRMGQMYQNARLTRGRTIEDVVCGGGITAKELNAFEQDGTPLTPGQLNVICGMLRTNASQVFKQLFRKMNPISCLENATRKSDPFSVDDKSGPQEPPDQDPDLSGFLEACANRPQGRVLFHLTRTAKQKELDAVVTWWDTMRQKGAFDAFD